MYGQTIFFKLLQLSWRGLSEEHPTRPFRVPPMAEHHPQVYVIRRNKNNRRDALALWCL